jgi:hypothetical protein
MNSFVSPAKGSLFIHPHYHILTSKAPLTIVLTVSHAEDKYSEEQVLQIIPFPFGEKSHLKNSKRMGEGNRVVLEQERLEYKFHFLSAD